MQYPVLPRAQLVYGDLKTFSVFFQKQKFPVLHSLIITKAGKKEMNDCLNMYSEQIESTNGRETIRLVVAKDDGPWKTWKTNSQAVRFIKTQTAVKEGWY